MALSGSERGASQFKTVGHFDGKKRTDGHTGQTYLETGENYYLCSGKTVSEVSKIHTFLILIFKTVLNIGLWHGEAVP